jgi:Laminin G domain
VCRRLARTAASARSCGPRFSACAAIRGRTWATFVRPVSILLLKHYTFSISPVAVSVLRFSPIIPFDFSFLSDINEKALTFINRESYLKRNYLSNALPQEKTIFRAIMEENILVNLRTYDDHSLVLYANDHFNNFIHLYVTNSNEVVYLFNYGNEIVNLTIMNNELNSGKSIQVAITRTKTSTTMHVNEKNTTIDKGFLLLEEYSNRPWANPEKGE